MKKFIYRALLLIVPLVLLFFTITVFIPLPTYLHHTLLFSQIEKDKMLRETPGPRIIFVGGSNTSFGLDCQIIKDSLGLNPINTGIHGGLGLKYILRNTLMYVRKGDIVVVAPEYQMFYEQLNDGQKELLFNLFDVAPDTKKLVDRKQAMHLLKFIPDYCWDKMEPFNYMNHHADTMIRCAYCRLSFDQYGDACRHWRSPKGIVTLLGIDGTINDNAFETMDEFKKGVEAKQARIFLTFPGYQDTSFNRSYARIKIIEQRLKQSAFVFLGTPERYKIPDSLIFDEPYHLSHAGAIYRTKLLVADLKQKLK